MMTIEDQTPASFNEAMQSEDSDDWRAAMDKEMESMKQNQTWDLVPAPQGKNVVGSRWVYKNKTSADGTPSSYKARLVAQGFSQKHGEDYMETFSPVISLTGLRIFFGIAAAKRMAIHHMDISTAYLNSTLSTEIYMRQPVGYQVKRQDGQELVCNLKKAIYGLKQAGREWWHTISNFLISFGLKPLETEPCLFKMRTNDAIMLLALYVDDIAIAATKADDMVKLKMALSKRFKLKDLGKIEWVLGIKVDIDQRTGNIILTQTAAIDRYWINTE